MTQAFPSTATKCGNCGHVNAPNVTECVQCRMPIAAGAAGEPAAGGAGGSGRTAVILVVVLVVGLLVLGVPLVGAIAWYLLAADESAPVAVQASADEPRPCAIGNPDDCQAQCSRGDAPSCRVLGTMQQSGAHLPRDEAAAATSHRRACDGGDPLGCAYLAAMHAEGQGVPKDVSRARALFDQACERGEKHSCLLGADARGNPWHGAVDEHEAPSAGDPQGSATVSGRLPREVIQRIIRQNTGRFRKCYEDGLARNPKLAGQASVRFVIGRDGSVANVANAGSDPPDPAVVSCVITTTRRTYLRHVDEAPESPRAAAHDPPHSRSQVVRRRIAEQLALLA